MKKVLAVLLAATMVLSLAACGGGKKEETTKAAAETTKAAEETTKAADDAETTKAAEEAAAGDVVADVNGDGKIIVGYISKNLTDPFHAPINDLANETFDGLVADGTIDEWTGIIDGQTDANKQIDGANDCIAKGCDFVFILPAEAEASDPAVTSMAEAGINVIVVNSATTSTEDVALALCQSDDVYAGQLMAEWINEQLPDGGKYVHCQGVIGNSAQIQRGEGIAANLNDNFEMVNEAACDWDGAKAVDAASAAVAQYGEELVAVICDNDDMSSSVQTWCNENGRSDIKCIGVDGNETPLQMIKAGELGATVLQNGVGQLQAGVDVMLDVINNGKAPAEKTVMVPFELVTADNVDEFLK